MFLLFSNFCYLFRYSDNFGLKKISKVYSDKSVQNKNEAVFVKVKLIHKFSYYEFETDIFVKTSSSSHCFLM